MSSVSNLVRSTPPLDGADYLWLCWDQEAGIETRHHKIKVAHVPGKRLIDYLRSLRITELQKTHSPLRHSDRHPLRYNLPVTEPNIAICFVPRR